MIVYVLKTTSTVSFCSIASRVSDAGGTISTFGLPMMYVASSLASSASKPFTCEGSVGSCCDSSGASSASATMSLPRFLIFSMVESERMRSAFATGAPASTESPDAVELASLPGSAVFPEQAVTASVTAASRTPATALFLRMLRVMGCIPF